MTPSLFSNLKSLFEKKSRREAIEGYLLIAAGTSVILFFSIFVMLYAFYLSFFSWDFPTPMKFVGVENYVKVFEEIWDGICGGSPFRTQFFIGIKNVLFYTAIVVPTQTILAIILAVFANQKIKGISFYKVSYFLPSVTCSVIIALIFVWLFQKEGLINYFLSSMIPGFAPNWMRDVHYALWAIMLVAIWGTSGNLMISFLAALQALPQEVYEAASIDGAGRFKKFFYITLPLLKPMIGYSVVVGTIGCLQMFDLAYAMPGPGFSTTTVVQNIYNTCFAESKVGLACAKSFFLFAVIFAITYAMRRKFRYETT